MQGYLITLYEIENVPQSSRQMFLRIPRSHFFSRSHFTSVDEKLKMFLNISPNVSQDSKISLFSRSHFTSVACVKIYPDIYIYSAHLYFYLRLFCMDNYQDFV